jgi:hypothetical protein
LRLWEEVQELLHAQASIKRCRHAAKTQRAVRLMVYREKTQRK